MARLVATLCHSNVRADCLQLEDGNITTTCTCVISHYFSSQITAEWTEDVKTPTRKTPTQVVHHGTLEC